MRLKFGAFKVFVFEWKVSFKVLMTFSTIFCNFARAIVNDMKPKDIWCSKGIIFSHNSTHHPFWMYFKWKCTDTWANALEHFVQWDNNVQLWSWTVSYSCLHNAMVINNALQNISSKTVQFVPFIDELFRCCFCHRFKTSEFWLWYFVIKLNSQLLI
jgi:hypothetical protein